MEVALRKKRRKSHLGLYQSKAKRRRQKITSSEVTTSTSSESSNSSMHCGDVPSDSTETEPCFIYAGMSDSRKRKADNSGDVVLCSSKKKKILRPLNERKQLKSSFSKKVLKFGFDYKIECEHKIKSLAPKVIDALSNAGGSLLSYFIILIDGIANGTLPVTNIAFLLLLERAKLQSINSTTNMSYMKDTVIFWKVVYRLCGGAAIRLFSGPKHVGATEKGDSKGNFDPITGDINFAVPDLKTLRNNDFANAVPKTVQPGIIEQAVDILSVQTNKEFVLAVDGKKIAQGINSDGGDINLWGYEHPKLKDENKRLKDNICTNKLIHSALENTPVNLPLAKIESDELRSQLCKVLQQIARNTTMRIEDLRKVNLSQSFLSSKLTKMSDENPALKDKYNFAINKTKAVIHQCGDIVTNLLHINREICKMGSLLAKDTNYNCEDVIDISAQSNIVHLQNPEDLSDEFQVSCYIKQHSPEWHDLRKLAPVTGSTLHSAIGLRSLKEQKQHIKILKGEIVREFSAETQEMLDHGSKNEINAVATFAGQILPFIYPGARFFETGPHFILASETDKLLMEVSPDGAVRDRQNRLLSSVEIKCPIARPCKLPVMYTIPSYYVLQLLAEMVAQACYNILFICYSKASTTVCKAHFHADLWDAVKMEVEAVYGTDQVALPTKLSGNLKQIKTLLNDFLENNVELVIEVPSQVASELQEDRLTSICPYKFAADKPTSMPENVTVKDLIKLSDKCIQHMNEQSLVCRKKASEILAFIVADTDRLSHPEYPHHLPIAYGLKGYSLSGNILRQMCEDVKTRCADKGISILCESFDGQWHSLTVRSADGNPLTRLELQKDIWREACAMSKSQQTILLKNLFVIDKNSMCDTLESVHDPWRKSLSLNTKGMLMLEHVTPHATKLWQKNKSNKKANEELSNENINRQDTAVDIQNAVETGDDLPSEIINSLEPKAGTIDEFEMSVEDDKDSVQLTDVDFDNIRQCLQELNKTKWTKKFSNMQLLEFRQHFNAKNINKFTKVELLAIAKCIDHPIHSTAKKSCIATHLNMIAGDRKLFSAPKQFQINTLRELSYKALSSKTYPKAVLNVIVAKHLSPKRVREWEEHAPIPMTVIIDNKKELLFSHPEYCSKHNKLEPKVIDPSHLLVNNRSRLLDKGLCNLDKNEFVKICTTHPKSINRALIVDIVDKQSVSLALKVFSPEVESALTSNGAQDEAEYVSLVREWYNAIDSPGISAIERLRKLLAFKQYLMKGIHFDTFPPPGAFVKNMSAVQFSGFIQNTDTRISLYNIAASRTYNHRAIGTLSAESFFSDLTAMDPTGCPKAVNIPKMMSNVTEINHFRHNKQNRVFHMVTKKSSVYPTQPVMDDTNLHEEPLSLTLEDTNTAIINPRNHFFDHKECRKTRRKKHTDISLPHETSRGERPIRCIRYKKDESKILATTRLNIEHIC